MQQKNISTRRKQSLKNNHGKGAGLLEPQLGNLDCMHACQRTLSGGNEPLIKPTEAPWQGEVALHVKCREASAEDIWAAAASAMDA